jgi:ribonuclease-3
LSAEELPHIIGYEFARRELLEEALTHPSSLVRERGRRRARTPVKHGYERLEFLGDRVLGLIIADYLWRRFEDEPEGDLTRRHAHLVRREALVRVAETIGLGRYLVLSRAEAAPGAAGNPGILADACEALIAAIYIEEMEEPPRDPKTALQEWVQARGLALPVYELVATNGPDHAPLFTVAARVKGFGRADATASSKRAAEAKAAAMLLDRLTAEP